jgi:cytochrome c biogenesis protein CcmG/thiol:disulfide interchange protein DsbE
MAWRRLPLSWLLFSTAVALGAAGVVVLVLGPDDGDGGNASVPAAGMEVTPQGDLPESVDDVVLGSLDGGPDQRLGELMDGRPMVVNFFGSWCRPCLEEMPDFERVHQDHRGHVAFVGLAENDPADRARAMVERTGVTFPAYIDPNGSALTAFGGVAMPTTAFLGADGEVLEVVSEPLSEDELRSKLGEHFGLDA